MHVMKTLVGVLDWGLPVDQAIALPNIFLSGNAILVEKGTSLDAMRDRLTALGHIVTPAELGSKVNAVERRDGAWKGGADPRRDRKSVVEGKSVSVRVDLGGRRILKQKKVGKVTEELIEHKAKMS